MAHSASKLTAWLSTGLILGLLVILWLLDLDCFDAFIIVLLLFSVVLIGHILLSTWTIHAALPLHLLLSTTARWTQSRWLMHQIDLVLHHVDWIHVLVYWICIHKTRTIQILHMIHISGGWPNEKLLLLLSILLASIGILTLIRGSCLLLHLHVSIFILLICLS